MTVGVWRSNCPYRAADPEDIDPCPHCDANNPVPTPAVGHVCEASLTGRTPSEPTPAGPSLCWICGKALPHDCVESAHPQPRWQAAWEDRQPIDATQGSVTVSPAGANVLISTIHDQPRFLVERADVVDLIACLARAYGLAAPVTHGPPLRFNGPTPSTVAAHARALADLHDVAEVPAKRLAPIGHKWPIGTQDGQLARVGDLQVEWGARLAHARHHANLTLDALARRLNPPRTRKDISAMEHGRRCLSVELCAQLADALDCDRLWLAGWTLEGTP